MAAATDHAATSNRHLANAVGELAAGGLAAQRAIQALADGERPADAVDSALPLEATGYFARGFVRELAKCLDRSAR